jgi:hypothetical protein
VEFRLSMCLRPGAEHLAWTGLDLTSVGLTPNRWLFWQRSEISLYATNCRTVKASGLSITIIHEVIVFGTTQVHSWDPTLSRPGAPQLTHQSALLCTNRTACRSACSRSSSRGGCFPTPAITVWRIANKPCDIDKAAVIKSWIEMAASLCLGCQKVDFASQYTAASQAERRWLKEFDSSKHAGLASIESLAASAKSCQCCELLLRGIEEAVRNATSSAAAQVNMPWREMPLSIRISAAMVKHGRPGNNPITTDRHVDVQLGFDEEEVEDVYATLWLGTMRSEVGEFALDHRRGSWHDRVVHYAEFHCRDVPPSLPLAGAADMITNWHSECDTFHRHCEATKTHRGGLPDRVLDVGTAAAPSLKLFVTANEQQPYIALSYCWGTRPQSTTTKSNIEQSKLTMDEGQLPKTIKDAIEVTRCLGVRYLWVDALCIIQDDGDDWAVQSTKMAQVYGDSYLTVCAANAAGVYDGFSRPREQQVLVAVGETVSSWSAGDGGQVKEQIYIMPGSRPGGVRFDNPEISQNAIATRAWCFQERIVAPRKVFFLENQIAWECRKMVAFETGVKRIKDTSGFLAMVLQKWPEYDLRTHLDNLQWTEIVELYSTRKLTKITDRLPALSAVAALYAERVAQRTDKRPRYLAGHWEDALAASLLWRTLGGVEDIARAQPDWWWAPSWSWASCKKPILFDVHAGRPLWSDLECDVQLDGPNLFGPIKGAQLWLRAPLLLATCTPSASEGEGCWDVSYRETHLQLSNDDQFRGGHDPGIFFDTDAPPQSIYLLVLQWVGSTNSDGTVNLHGLLLQRHESSTKAFTRIGTFWNCTLDLTQDGKRESDNLAEIVDQTTRVDLL